MSDDMVMVQPVRTFLEGPDLKHPDSDPYPVSRARMLELRGNGLVEHVEPTTAPAAAEPAAEAPAAPAEPRKRGRPPNPR